MLAPGGRLVCVTPFARGPGAALLKSPRGLAGHALDGRPPRSGRGRLHRSAGAHRASRLSEPVRAGGPVASPDGFRAREAARARDSSAARAAGPRGRSAPALGRAARSGEDPAQALGRRTVGCEGTHGVFPRCDLACTPCYHSRDANRVRVDGAHTAREIDAQMALMRRERGPGQNAQLIGGEVTLLSPDEHAEALLVMRGHGRKPIRCRTATSTTTT